MNVIMKVAAPIFVLLVLAFPATLTLAQEGCPNNCPEGMVWSQEKGKCEPYKPLMV